jgi:predicted PurR-regulated permease PerM
LTGIALVAVTALLWLNRRVLLLAFGAIVFSTVIRSVGDGLARITKLRGRWAVLAAVLLLAAGIGALFWLFGLRIADEFTQLQQALPQGVQSIRKWAGTLPHGGAIVSAVDDALQSDGIAKFAAAARIATAALTTAVVMAFAAIYFAIDPGLYRRGVLSLVPLAKREQVARAVDRAGEALTKWVRAQLVLMLAVGTLTGVGLAVVGVPLAFSLALIIGLFEFIPLLGPILGAVPGILLAFTKGPDAALYALLVYVGVQQFENNLMTPLVQRWAVQLPPALALFAAIAGGLTFGLLGVVFATPLAVVVMVLLQELYVKDTLERGGAAPARPRGRHRRRPPEAGREVQTQT